MSQPTSYRNSLSSCAEPGADGNSEWAYKQLEAAYDGVIDLRLVDEGESTKDLIRIRSMCDVSHDRDWHELRIGSNFEVTVQGK